MQINIYLNYWQIYGQNLNFPFKFWSYYFKLCRKSKSCIKKIYFLEITNFTIAINNYQIIKIEEKLKNQFKRNILLEILFKFNQMAKERIKLNSIKSNKNIFVVHKKIKKEFLFKVYLYSFLLYY